METFPTINQLYIKQPSDMIQNLNKFSYPLDKLASPCSVNVSNTSISCCARCCIPICCSDNYEYMTSIEDKPLFKSRGKLSCKISSTDRLNNFKSFESLPFPQENSLNKEETLYCEKVAIPKCYCCGIGKIIFKVKNQNEKYFGKMEFGARCCENAHFCDSCQCCDIELCTIKEIKECLMRKKCCYEEDKICDIFDSNDKEKYTIYLRKCPYFPINFCCIPEFIIKDNSFDEVGEIINISKNCCALWGISGINYTYKINFPDGATPDLKLTIIHATMIIDMTMY